MHDTGSDTDTDTEGSNAMDDSEGSLEDAIASIQAKSTAPLLPLPLLTQRTQRQQKAVGR